jgi:hypothetical protein
MHGKDNMKLLEKNIWMMDKSRLCPCAHEEESRWIRPFYGIQTLS